MRTVVLGLTIGLLGGTAGCSSSATGGATSAPTDKQLEIVNWWVNPGETDALTALINLYNSKYPKTKVINGAVDGATKGIAEIASRMTSNTPPDTFQTLGAGDLWQWVAYNGMDASQSKMEELDFIANANNLRAALPQSVLDVVSYANHMYAIPIGIHRFNSMFYSKAMFAQYNLTPPVTLDDLYTVCDTLKAKGVQYPLALGTQIGQELTMWVWDGIFIGQTSVDYHDSFFSGKEDITDPATIQKLQDALDAATKVLSCTNPDRATLQFAAAADMVIHGKSAMTFIGDFAKGYFLAQGWKSDVDLGEGPTPGSNGAFTYVVDSFGLPKGAQDRDAAVNYLNMLAQPYTQALFGPIKGATPPRTDVDPSKFDSLAQAAMAEFKAGPLARATDLVSKSPSFAADLDNAMGQFSVDLNAQTIINIIKNRYDELK
jgi:glucose/mannose transport system substrate-binding protein